MWPFRRREHAEAPPAEVGEVLRPPRAEWRGLAPIPVVQATPLGTLDRSFEESLVTRGRPLFLGALSHHVHPDAPGGTVQGLARPAATVNRRDLAPTTPAPAQRIVAAPEAPAPEVIVEPAPLVAVEPPTAVPSPTAAAIPATPVRSSTAVVPPATSTWPARAGEAPPGERMESTPAPPPVVVQTRVETPALTRVAAPAVVTPPTVARAVVEARPATPAAPMAPGAPPTATGPAPVAAVADEPAEVVEEDAPGPTAPAEAPADTVTDRPVLARRTPLGAEPATPLPAAPVASPSAWRIGEPLAPADRPASDTVRPGVARPTPTPRLGAPLERTADGTVDPVPSAVVAPASTSRPDPAPVDVAPLVGDAPAVAAVASGPLATDPGPGTPPTAVAAPVQRTPTERARPVHDEPVARPVLGVGAPIVDARPSPAAAADDVAADDVAAVHVAPPARWHDVALVGARDVAMTITAPPAVPAAPPAVQRAAAPAAAVSTLPGRPPVLRAGPVPPTPGQPQRPAATPVASSPATTTGTWTTPPTVAWIGPEGHVGDDEATTTITIQRAADDTTLAGDAMASAPELSATSDTVPAAGTTATTSSTASTAATTVGGGVAGATSEAELLELARVLYPQLQRRLARDLLVDRERAGYRTDIRF